MRRVVIVGASGHGKVIADIVHKSGDIVIGFLDDNPELYDTFIGLPILGTIKEWGSYKDYEFVIAIGNAVVREKISRELAVRWYTAIHPNSVVSSIDVSIGIGTVIMANAVVNSGSKIGNHCIINTGAVVEHDNKLEDFVHISVGAKLAGTVSIAKGTWIGIGAVVKNNLSICGSCLIGAGAVVVKDITISGTYVGVPAEMVADINNRKIGEITPPV